MRARQSVVYALAGWNGVLNRDLGLAHGFDQYVEDEWPGGLDGYADGVRRPGPI